MFFLNHLEVSSQEIKSCCNNNPDEESTFYFSHYMDTRQSEMCKFKEIAKILEFFTKLNARHTFWSLLIRCVNMKWVRLVLWKIHSGHDSVHRRKDEKVETSIHPFNFVERGYNKKKRYEIDKTAVNSQKCKLWGVCWGDLRKNYIVIIPSHCTWIFLNHNSLRSNDASVSYIIIGWDNGFSLTRHQVII